MEERRMFCQKNKLCYRISILKEYLLRDLTDLFSKEKAADQYSEIVLPNIVKEHRSILIRKLHGIDEQLQKNKAVNLKIACKEVNGIIVRPGEYFSFWKLIGIPSKRKGYLDGLTISIGKTSSGIGGGLCQLANLIHWLVLNSPLEVTELHHHTDALFPDSNRNVPFGTGTSVFYKNVDYRFKNNTDQNIQVLVWVNDTELCGELRSEYPFPYRYRIVEENSRYIKEDEEYYRVSKVYKLTINKDNGLIRNKELVLDNHSKVMYDHSLIPEAEILQYNTVYNKER